ncbi:MAG: type II secretion system protein GspN [Desulfobacterales bacterium]
MDKKKWFLYSVYAVALAIFFVYYLFPTERLKTFIVMQIGRVNPALRVTVAKAGLMLPPGVRLQRVRVDHDNDPLLFANDLAIVPHLKTLLSDKKLYSFRMKTYEGTITGTAEIDDSGQVTIDAVVAGLKLSDIPFLKRLSANHIEGILDGKFAYVAASGKPEALDINLDINNMAVTLGTPLFTLDRVRFDKVHADAVLRNRLLEITRVALTGDQIEGNLAGSASLNTDLMLSIVNLNGTVMPQKQFLENSGFQVSGSILAGLKAGGGIPIRISGPLGDLQLATR